jgi:hypothetical protein
MNDRAKMIGNGAGAFTSQTRTVTICGNEITTVFDPRPGDLPRLTWTKSGVTSGPAVTGLATWAESGCNYVDFDIGDPRLCTGTRACGGPCANTTRLRVQYSPCPYAGPGFYCVRTCGTADAGSAVELNDDDAKDGEIEILSGPYNTYAEAVVGCAPPTCHPPTGPDRVFNPGDKKVTFGGTLASFGVKILKYTTWPGTFGVIYKGWSYDVPYDQVGTPIISPAGFCGWLKNISIIIHSNCYISFSVSSWNGSEHFGRGLDWQIFPTADMPFAFHKNTDTRNFIPSGVFLCPGILTNLIPVTTDDGPDFTIEEA